MRRKLRLVIPEVAFRAVDEKDRTGVVKVLPKVYG